MTLDVPHSVIASVHQRRVYSRSGMAISMLKGVNECSGVFWEERRNKVTYNHHQQLRSWSRFFGLSFYKVGSSVGLFSNISVVGSLRGVEFSEVCEAPFSGLRLRTRPFTQGWGKTKTFSSSLGHFEGKLRDFLDLSPFLRTIPRTRPGFS